MPYVKNSDIHCNVIAHIIVAVVTVIATVYGGPMAGNFAGQVVGGVLGTQEGFDVASFAAAGIGNYVSTSIVSSGNAALTTQVANSTSVLNAAGVGVVTGAQVATSAAVNKAMGKPSGFSWRSAAAQVGASMITSSIGYEEPKQLAGFSPQAFAESFFGNIANAGLRYGVTKAFGGEAHWDFKKVAADAFGNALGNAIVSKMSSYGSDDFKQRAENDRIDAARLKNQKARQEMLGLGQQPLHSPVAPIDIEQLAKQNSGVESAPPTSPVKVIQQKAQTEGAENVTQQAAVSKPASKPTTSNIDLLTPIDFGPDSYENWFEAQANQAIANIWAESESRYGYGAGSDPSNLDLLLAFGGGVWDGFTGKLHDTGDYAGHQIYNAVEYGIYSTDAGKFLNVQGRGLGSELYDLTLGDFRDSSSYARIMGIQAFHEDMGGFAYYLKDNMSFGQAWDNLKAGATVVGDVLEDTWGAITGFFSDTSSIELARGSGLFIGEKGAEFALGGSFIKGGLLLKQFDDWLDYDIQLQNPFQYSYKGLSSNPFFDPDLYKSPFKIGFKSTTQGMRNQFKDTGYLDPFTNKYVSGQGQKLAVDHIVPVSEIEKMDGFADLTRAQQKAIIRDDVHLGNLQPLPTGLNSSKSDRMFEFWNSYKGEELNQNYIQQLTDTQRVLRARIQDQINVYHNGGE